MALETTTTTTMENGNGWYGNPYWGGQHYGSEFCSLEKSIGDAKAQILMANGASEARISDTVMGGQAGLLREIGTLSGQTLSKIGAAECSIIKEVNDAEMNVIDRLGSYAAADIKNQSDIASRTAGQLTDLERDLQNRIHETRFLLSKEISDKSEGLANKVEKVSDKSDAQFANVKDQLRYFETSVAKQFCHLETEGLKNTSKILETLAANKYDALKDEVDAIRADRYADKYGYNFALQSQELNSLKQMINSVEQTQKFNSKTVQFGNANRSGTDQTANQG
jgi:hypothetical protein